MKKFNVLHNINNIAGLCIIEPNIFEDNRGLFMETYNEQDFYYEGLNMHFVQDNQVFSKYGVLRGLHVNEKHPQGKLVRVLRGSIFDVVVDLRAESDTYGNWYGITLSAKNKKQLYIPERFAHGYLSLEPETEVLFKVTTHYIPGDERGIAWNSPNLAIEWPSIQGGGYILSESDKNNPPFQV